LISIGVSVLTVVSSIALFGLGAGITRFIAYYLEFGSSGLARVKGILTAGMQITLVISIPLSLTTFLFSEPIALGIFREPDLIPVLRVFAIATPFLALLNLAVQVFRGFKQIVYMIYCRQILEAGLRLLITGLFALLGFHLLGMSATYAISAAFASLVALYFIKKIMAAEVGLEVRQERGMQKELIKFSLPLTVGQILSQIRNRSDTLLLGYFLEAYQVGLYNAALPIAGLLQTGLNSLNRLFMPSVSELFAKGDLKELRQTYKRVAKWALGLTLPLFLVLTVFANGILEALFGTEYQAASSALIVISIGVLLNTITGSFGEVLIAIGETRVNMLLSFLLMGVNVVLGLLLIPKFGILGAAIANSVALAAAALSGIIYLYYLMKIQPFSLDHLKLVFSSSLAFALIYPIYEYGVGQGFSPYWLLLPLILILYGLTLIGIYWMRGLDEVEKGILRLAFRKLGFRSSDR